MIKEKRILSYFIGWLIIFFIVCFIGVNNIFAATYDNFDVTWYYRDMANESNLLNVVKNEETPFYKATDEYVNGFTTRIEQNFSKDIQYIVNYKLEMYYDISQDQYYRNDTIDRLIDYAWVDSDFKLLNTVVKQTEYECLSASICTRTISITQQVLALNNTTAIRFGVYTTENKSIGFYNSTQQVNYLMINNITIDENANSTIVDQNNQIIQGQDKLNQSIIDGNKETQEVIKDQFNSCHDSYNLLPQPYALLQGTTTKNGLTIKVNDNYSITISGTTTEATYINIANNINYFNSNLFTNATRCNNGYCLTEDLQYNNSSKLIYLYFGKGVTINKTYYPMITKEENKNISYEEYGKEICSNKIDDTNNKLEDIQGALTDSSAPNTSGLENSAGWLPAGPLDSILNLPLTMLNSLTNSLGKTCSPLNLTLPYVNKNIQIPCLSAIFEKITGVNGLWTWVGTIASVLILYNYLLNLYAWVDRILTLRAEFDEAMGADMANWGRL